MARIRHQRRDGDRVIVAAAEFLTPLRTEKIGPRRWLLTDELVYSTALLGGIFKVPRGFQTDFASIPRILWTLAPPVDRYDPAAVVHDAGYGNALTTQNDMRVYLIKDWCDRIFLEACLSVGVAKWRAEVMYQLVKTFGNPDGHPLAANRISTVALSEG